MPLRMRVHDREPIGAALRRFKKLLERSGLQKELRKRKHYEKPCEIRRRAELRKQSAIRKAKNLPMPGQLWDVGGGLCAVNKKSLWYNTRGFFTAHCPLPTAHCPLPTAHCPLPPNSPAAASAGPALP